MLLLDGKKQVIRAGERYQASNQQGTINLIGSGYILRYLITPDKKRSIQGIYGPGDIFPLTTVFRLLFGQQIYEGMHIYYYDALDDVKLFSINGNVLLEAVKKDPNLYKDLFIQAGSRLQANIQLLENAAIKDSMKRLVHQLVFYAFNFGVEVPDGLKINIPLKAEHLAEIIETSPGTVRQNLTKLKKDKLIDTRDYIVVYDAEKLQALTYA